MINITKDVEEDILSFLNGKVELNYLSKRFPILSDENNISFTYEGHLYTYKENPVLFSASNLQNYVFEPFERKRGLIINNVLKSQYNNYADKKDVLHAWDIRRERGTLLHKIAECWLNRPASQRTLDNLRAIADLAFTNTNTYKGSILVKNMTDIDQIYYFYTWYTEKCGWELIRTEAILHYRGVCGSVDAIFRKRDDHSVFSVVDWKTTDNVDKLTKGGNKIMQGSPFLDDSLPKKHCSKCIGVNLPICECKRPRNKLYAYGIQVSAYATMIEKTYGVTVDHCIIVPIIDNMKSGSFNTFATSKKYSINNTGKCTPQFYKNSDRLKKELEIVNNNTSDETKAIFKTFKRRKRVGEEKKKHLDNPKFIEAPIKVIFDTVEKEIVEINTSKDINFIFCN